MIEFINKFLFLIMTTISFLFLFNFHTEFFVISSLFVKILLLLLKLLKNSFNKTCFLGLSLEKLFHKKVIVISIFQLFIIWLIIINPDAFILWIFSTYIFFVCSSRINFEKGFKPIFRWDRNLVIIPSIEDAVVKSKVNLSLRGLAVTYLASFPKVGVRYLVWEKECSHMAPSLLSKNMFLITFVLNFVLLHYFYF